MNEGSKETNKNRTAFRLGRKMSFFALTPTITTTIADAKRVADAKFKLRLALRECMQCGLQIICLLRSMSSSPNMPDDIGTFLEGFYLFQARSPREFSIWMDKQVHSRKMPILLVPTKIMNAFLMWTPASCLHPSDKIPIYEWIESRPFDGLKLSSISLTKPNKTRIALI